TSPFNIVPTSGRPRTSTEVPTPASRLICTPVTRCNASVMVTSGNWPMLSAVMLSWMLGAMRFNSIARICDARTPTTLTTDNVAGVSFSGVVPALGFLACDWLVAGAVCVVACADELSTWVATCDAAAAEVANAANNAADMATDNELLRCTMGMAVYPSLVVDRARRDAPFERARGVLRSCVVQ